jgi:hypothetical protein
VTARNRDNARDPDNALEEMRKVRVEGIQWTRIHA